MPDNTGLGISSPYISGSSIDNSSILNTYVSINKTDNVNPAQIELNNQYKMIQDMILGNTIDYKGKIMDDPIRTSLSQAERYDSSKLGFSPLRDNEDLYTKNQGFFNSVGKGLGRLVLTTGTKLGQGIGYLGGLIGIDNNAGQYGSNFSSWIAGAADNAMAKYFENAEEDIKNDWLKIYQGTDAKGQGLFYRASHDLSFWTSDVSDGLAFMASSLIPGIAISKIGVGAKVVNGLRLLNSGDTFAEGVTNATRVASIAADEAMAARTAAQGLVDGTRLIKWISNAKVARGLDAALMTSINTASESMFEASQTKDEVAKSLVGKTNPKTGIEYTPEEINEQAAIAARNTFNLNMIALAPSNLWEAGLILKRLPSTSFQSAERIAQETLSSEARVIPRTLKQKMGDILKEGGTGIIAEGLWEENIQNAIQRVNKSNAGQGKDTFSTISDIGSQYVSQSIETFKGNDPDNSIAIGIGALMGLGGGVVKSIRGGLREETRLAETIKRINAARGSLFNSIGSVYETEEIEVTQPDGTKKKENRYKLDSEGNLIPDASKIEEFVNNQEQIFELQGLQDIADKEKNTTLSNIYKNKLFTEFAKAHFDAGTADVLFEKLDNLRNLKDQDLTLLGFDPASKKDGYIQIEQWKSKARELQSLYDSIQNNILSGSNSIEDLRINEARKGELFRLGSTSLILNDEIKRNQSLVTALRSKIDTYDPNLNSISDSIVDEANIRYAQVLAAQNYLDNIRDKQLVAPDEDYNIEGADDRLASVTKYYNQFVDDNKDSLANRKNEEGYHEYENASKNNILDKRDLELLNYKLAELSLNRAETLDLIERFANRTKGFNFYKNKISAINESRSTTPVESFRLKDKNLEQYISNENRRLRKERITTNYNDIMKKYQAEFLAENLPNMTFDEVDNLINELLNNDYALSKESLDLLRDKYYKEILSKKIEVQDNINKAQDRVNELYDLEDDELTEDDYQEIAYINNSLLPQLNDQLNNLVKSEEKLNKLKEYSKKDFNDNFLRRNIADNYLKEGKKIISDINQSDEGYDSQSDLDKVNDELEEAKQLLNFYQNRKDVNINEPEFNGLIDNIENQIADLEQAKDEITRRVNDRLAKDQKVFDQYTRQMLQNIGINVDNTTNSVFDAIKAFLSSNYKPEFDSAISLINNPDSTNLERLASAEAVQDILRLAYNKASETEKNNFLASISSYQNTIILDLEKNDILQSFTNIGSMTVKQMIDNYKKNPQSFIKFLLGTKDVRVTDAGKNGSVYKFLQDNDLQSLYDNAQNEDRTGSKFDRDTLVNFVDNTIKYVSTIDLLNNLNSRLTNLNEIQNEISIIEESIAETKKNKQNPDKVVQTPSNQQLIALRELSSFFFNDKDNELYNAFAYLKGVAGAGKSLVVAKWLPRLLRISKNEILATGHNISSTRTINNSLGLNRETDFDSVLNALETSSTVRLVIVDEVGGITREQLDNLAIVVANNNAKRSELNQIKVVLLGDPNQLNMTDQGLSEKPDIERVNTTNPTYDKNNNIIATNNLINNISIIRPLTIRYRSNVSSVSNFSDKFIDQNDDLTKEEIISTSNNPTLNQEILRVKEPIGVVGTTNFEGDLIRILNNSNLDDGRSRAIITNPENVERYKNLLSNNSIPLTQVEVLDYISAQGRTIDQVYIDIKNNTVEFTTNKIFNKAIYVASSRATEFTLVSNFNIINELDRNIEEDKNKKDLEVIDSSSKFLKDRQDELTYLTSNIGENNISQFDIVAPTIEQTETLPEEQTNDLIQDNEVEENYSEQGEVSGLTSDELTIEDATNLVRETNTNTNEEDIIHTLAFPSSLSTKNIIDISGNTLRVSDRELNILIKRGIKVDIINPSLKKSDKVYYVPVIDSNNKIYFSIVSNLKDKNNKDMPNKYRQVGIISDKEYTNLASDPDQIGLYKLLENSKSKGRANQISLSSSEFTNNNLIIAAEGVVGNSNFLNFVYNPTSYKQFSLKGTIDTFVKGFFRLDEQNQTKINSLQKAAKIRIFTINEIKSLNKDLSAGVPYLVIDNIYQGSSNTKGESMYIRLDRKILNNKTHNDFLNPIYEFINTIKKLESKINIKYGTKEFEDFIEKAIDPTNNQVEAEDKQLAKKAFELYRKEIPTTEVKVNTKVKYLDPNKSFTSVGKYENDDDIKGHKKGELYLINTFGKVVETKNGKDAFSGKDVVTQVKVQYKDIVNGVKQVITTDWLNIDELKTDNKQPGNAQHTIDKIFRANRAAIENLEIASRSTSRGNIAAFSLFGSKYDIDLEYLESIFNTDANGNNILGLRIPVPIKTSNINFTNQGTNSVSDKRVTDYYIQSNFEKVIPTRISIITDKKTKPSNKIEVIENREGPAQTDTGDFIFAPDSENNNNSDDISDDDLLDNFQPRITPGRRLDKSKYTEEELGENLTKERIISFVKSIIPTLTNEELNNRVQLVNEATMLQLTNGKKAWGLFKDNMIYLTMDESTLTAKEKALKHEVFHLIFNSYLNSKERSRFMEELKKDKPFLKFMTKDEQLEYVDEYLAEQFQNYIPKKNLNYYINYILRKISKFLSFIGPNIKSFNDLFDSINQGYFTKSSLDNLEVDRALSDIKKDYEGSTHVYRIARDLFSDILDQFMHPSGQVIELNGKLKNVPLTRVEAVELFKKWISAYKNKFGTDLSVNDENYYVYKALQALSKEDINGKWIVLDKLIKEFYPNFKYKKVGDKYKYIESNQNTEREEDSDEDYEDLSIEPTTNTDEAQDEIDGDETLKNRENWNNDEDTINPLRKASQAVKDIMSNVLVTVQDNIRERVKPGYVFFKLLQNLSNIDVSDISNFNRVDINSEEKKLVKNNFLSNGMNDNNLSTNRDYQIYRKLEDLLDTSNIQLDENGKILPSNQYFKWIGDNQKGYYEFINNNKSISLKDLTVEQIYRAVKNNSDLSYQTINILYQKAEAAESINSIYFVVNSLRAKYPMFAEFEWKFTSNSKQYLVRKYGQFKEEYHLSPVRTNIENILTNSYNKLLDYKDKINAAKKTKSNNVNLVKQILKETNMLLTKRDIFISPVEADNLVNTFDGIINLADKIGKVEIIDDDGNKYNYSGLDLVSDSTSYIKNITNIVARSEKELGRNSSYRGADNKQRWFHMLSNQALDILDSIINNKPLKSFLRNPNTIFKYNIFNPVETNEHKLNTIYSFRDHDSIENITENSDQDPISYRKEDRKSWFDRNFFYGFTKYLTTNTAKGNRYIQQFYTISNKPNILSAEIDVLKYNDIKEAIKTAIIQEANRSADNVKNYSKNIKNRVSNLIGLEKALTRDELYEENDLGSLSFNAKNLNEAIDKVYNAMSNRAEEVLESIMDLNITLDRDFVDASIKLHIEKFIDPKFSSPTIDIRSVAGNYRSDKLIGNDREQFKSIVLPIFDIYYKNYYINSLFLNQIVSGDQSQFKNSYDQVKRMSMVFATGNKGRVNNQNGLKRTFKVAVIQGITDEKLSNDPLFETFKRLLGKNYEVTDAQGYITPERAENIRRGFSREANLGATMKPVYYGIGDDGIARGVKYSTVEISNELARAFPQLRELRYQMTFGNSTIGSNDRVRELYDKLIDNLLSQIENDEYRSYIDQVYNEDTAIDELLFDSAFKVGSPNTFTVFDPNNITIDPASVVTLNNAYYRHQLNPRHDVDGKTSNPSQLTYQINTNGKNFKELYKVLKLNSIIHYAGVEDFVDDFFPNGEVNKESISKIRNMLSEILAKVPGNERTVEFLEGGLSLNVPFIVNKLIQTFNSKMSKSTVRIKHKGSKLVLQSMFGTQATELSEQGFREPRLVFIDKDGNEVSNSSKAVSYHMEVYMPDIYKNKISVDEKVYYDNELYNTIMGFRIPSTELHSAVPLKIIGFYPSQFGDNIIIAPKELVLLHGSDFDIDSLYTINPYLAEEDIISPDNRKITEKGSRIGYTQIDKSVVNKNQSFTEFLLDEINKYKTSNIKSNIEYVDKLKNIIKKAASNEILESFLDIIKAERNIQDMMTPITMSQLNDLEDPNSVFSMFAKLNAKKLGKTLEDKPTDPVELDIWKEKAMSYIRSPRNLNDIYDEMLMHKDNFQSAMLTGMFANAFKAVSYIFMGTNKFDTSNLEEDQQPLPKIKSSVRRFDIDFIWDGDIYTGFNRYVIENGKLQDGTSNTDRNTTWQTLDALINAAIDHVKEQILNIINASDKTGNAIVAATALGIPIRKTSLLMMQPTIQEISNTSKFQMNIIREDIKQALFENALRNNKSLRNQFDNIEDLNNEDWKKNIKSTNIFKNFIDKILEEVNNTPITTENLEKGYMINYNELSSSSYKDLIFQLRVLKEFEKLNYIGDYITTVAMSVKSVQDLPSEFSGLEILEERYNKLFDLDAVYNNIDPNNINNQLEVKIPDSFPFSNVNISNIPNVRSSLYVIKTLMNNLGKIFLKNSDILRDFAEDINDLAQSKGDITELEDENTPPKTYKTSFIIKGAKAKGLQVIRDNFIEYLLSGASYIDETGRAYSMDTANESKVETTVKRYQWIEETKVPFNTQIEYSGLSAWNIKFIDQGYITTLPDGTKVKMLSLREIKKKYENENYFLKNLEIKLTRDKYNRDTGVSYLRMTIGGSLDNAEKIDYQNDFENLKNYSIYETLDGKSISPEVLSNDQFNELQHNLLKYSVLNQGLAFGSQNFSSLMSPSIFNEISKYLDNSLSSLDETKLSNIKEHFLPQIMLNNMTKLSSLFKYGVSFREGDKKEPLAGFDENTYFDAKIDLINNSRDTSTLPVFAKYGSGLYYQVNVTEKAAYYQRIARVALNKNYQSSNKVLTDGYKLKDYFNKETLGIGVKLIEFDNNEYAITLNKKDQKTSIINQNDVIFVYNDSDITRISGSKFKVIKKRFSVDTYTYSLESIDNLNSELNISTESTRQSKDQLNNTCN